MIEKTGAMILLSLFFVAASYSQVTFERTYGGPDADGACSVIELSDGGYIIGGYTNSYGSGNCDVYIIRTDANGDTLWTRTFDSEIPENLGVAEGGYCIQGTQDGGYIIAGVYSLIKLDSLGNFAWTKTCEDWYFSVQPTLDSGYIVAGGIISPVSECDVCLVKTDKVGDTVWTRTYGGADWDCGWSILETSDGGYVISGETYSYGTGNGDVYLIRTDPDGDTMWTKTHDTGWDEEVGWSIQPTLDGGYIIAGGSSFIKTDAMGDTGWTMPYWICMSAQQTSDSGYVVGGGGGGGDPGYWDLYFTKADSMGNSLWTRTYGGDDFDIGSTIRQTSDGGYVIAGCTSSYGSGAGDVYLIKTDENGFVEVEEEQTHDLQHAAVSVSPNPFTISTKVDYSIPQTSYLDLSLYDVSGRLVKNLVRGRVATGRYFILWDGIDSFDNPAPSGVYFLSLICQPSGQSCPFRHIQKLIKMK